MKGLNIPGETWMGDGVIYCAECSEHPLDGKDVIVVGGVEETIEEVLHLVEVASKVYFVNHKNAISISDQVIGKLKRKGIYLIQGFIVNKIEGKPPLKQVVLRSLDSPTSKTLEADAVMIVGGVKPFVEVLRRAGLRTHRLSCIITDKFGRTNVNGVFAAGSCTCMAKDIISVCVGDGIKSATAARLYLDYGRF
jgi:thioredoxin reductase